LQGCEVKLLLIYVSLALATGLGLPIVYFSLAKFFAANARALDRNQKAAEQMATSAQNAQPLETRERLDGFEALQKAEIKTAAKAGK
jgi:hypothetical protein